MTPMKIHKIQEKLKSIRLVYDNHLLCESSSNSCVYSKQEMQPPTPKCNPLRPFVQLYHFEVLVAHHQPRLIQQTPPHFEVGFVVFFHHCLDIQRFQQIARQDTLAVENISKIVTRYYNTILH